MFSYTLFELGPFKVCLWNLLALLVIIIVSIGLRRTIHRSLKRYLRTQNIRLEGRKETWLRLLSQSIYILTIYVSILSFRINNENITFSDFLDYLVIDTRKFDLSILQIILVIGWYLGARILVNLLKLYFNKKFRKEADYNPSTEFVYIQVSKYIIYIFTFYLILETLNINLKLFLGGSAALLVGLGLGLQDVFKDMFSGLVLLFEGTLKIGDVIELQDSKFKEPIVAKILKINVRTTQIETRDGNVLMIPNAKLTQEYIENWNHGSDLTRFLIPITVKYGSDTKLASQLLKQAALSHPKVKKNEPIQVRLKNFGTNGIELELLFWADQGWEASNYKSDIRFEIDRLFRQYGIQIPTLQMDIQIKQSKE